MNSPVPACRRESGITLDRHHQSAPNKQWARKKHGARRVRAMHSGETLEKWSQMMAKPPYLKLGLDTPRWLACRRPIAITDEQCGPGHPTRSAGPDFRDPDGRDGLNRDGRVVCGRRREEPDQFSTCKAGPQTKPPHKHQRSTAKHTLRERERGRERGGGDAWCSHVVPVAILPHTRSLN